MARGREGEHEQDVGPAPLQGVAGVHRPGDALGVAADTGRGVVRACRFGAPAPVGGLRPRRAGWPPCVRLCPAGAGRPAAAGRLSGDGASGRAIERIATPRDGIARCRLDNWLRKSETEEFGRFSILERSNGGTSTAAHAAATTSRTS